MARTVDVQPLSSRRETGAVLRAMFHVILWTSLVIAAERGTGPHAAAPAQPALSAADQQTVAAVRSAEMTAEGERGITGGWPDTLPPIEGYTWTTLRDGTLIDYVATAPGRTTFAVVIGEPDPGTPIDPNAQVDDIHHRLPDGVVIHVMIFQAPPGRTLAAATFDPPPQDGWQLVRAPAAAPAPSSGPLRIGVTMHPYYSWVANLIAGIPDATVVPILPGEIDAGDYQPSPDDIVEIANLDAIVVNGLGHDAFIGDMIQASGNTKLAVIDASTETPTVPFAHGDAPNSHTFLSFTNAIQETGYLARKLGELRPALAAQLAQNAAAYVARLRDIRDSTAQKLANARVHAVVTVHDGYAYLLKEFGITLAGVVQPAHGLTPSPAELADLIEVMKRAQVTVVLTEESFPDKLLAALREATGARVYVISHVAVGTYSAEEYERVMQQNADVLVRALVQDAP